MTNQDSFEELSQALVHKMTQAEDVLSQLGSRIDNKQTLITQLEAVDVSSDYVKISQKTLKDTP